MTDAIPTDERDALAKIIREEGLDDNGMSPHGWRCENPDRFPDYCTCVNEMVDAILAAGFRRQGPITDEWEWGAIWTNGVVEGKWFDMGDSFAIREAAERQVDGYADPLIVLGRRRKAGPWEPVEAARSTDV